MKLLIPRVTDSTKRKDLRGFADRVIEKLFRLPFSAQPRIVSYQILSIFDSTGVTQRHGLIDVTPDDAALRVIRKLNGGIPERKARGGKAVQACHLTAENTRRLSEVSRYPSWSAETKASTEIGNILKPFKQEQQVGAAMIDLKITH